MTYRITYRKYHYTPDKGEEEIFTTEDVKAEWLDVPNGGGVVFYNDEDVAILFIEECYRVELVDD